MYTNVHNHGWLPPKPEHSPNELAQQKGTQLIDVGCDQAMQGQGIIILFLHGRRPAALLALALLFLLCPGFAHLHVLLRCSSLLSLQGSLPLQLILFIHASSVFFFTCTSIHGNGTQHHKFSNVDK